MTTEYYLPCLPNKALKWEQPDVRLDQGGGGGRSGIISCVDKKAARVWVQLTEVMHDVTKTEEICQSIASSTPSCLVSCSTPAKEVLYLVRWNNGKLYRGTILMYGNWTTPTVYCIDWGFMGKMEFANIFLIPEEGSQLYDYPPLAVPIIICPDPSWPTIIEELSMLNIENTYCGTGKQITCEITNCSNGTPGFCGIVKDVETGQVLNDLVSLSTIRRMCFIM